MIKRIGLLGGSFNPAHEGHLYISYQALKILGLDQVWWVVANQNPLKKTSDMAPFEMRLQSAKEISKKDCHICVKDDEIRLESTFSIDVVRYFRRTNRQSEFVWIMGSDIVPQFHLWKHWDQLIAEIPIFIVSRGLSFSTLVRSKFFRRFHSKRVAPIKLMQVKNGHWAMASGPVNPVSSTEIRAAKRAGNVAGIMIQ